MRIEQYVMAYKVEQDRLRAMMPEGFETLRPVLRINAEIRGGCGAESCADADCEAYVEFNVPAARGDFRGWLNIDSWSSRDGELKFERDGNTVRFSAPFLEIDFTGVGLEGGCPAEKDNQGCVFSGCDPELRLPESITSNKEFCDCSFAWSFSEGDAHGKSEGKTLPAFCEKPATVYKKQELTAANAAAIPCQQVLGTYKVIFERTEY